MVAFRSILCVFTFVSLMPLTPYSRAGDSDDSLSQRRALFRIRQDERFARKAMERMELLPWQREAIQILLDEQSRTAELFRFGSDLQGRDFEAKIQEVIEVTRHKIVNTLQPEQKAEWMRLISRRSLTFATKRVLVTEIPDGGPDS